ncbi:nucleoside triphosphate pyrophosphohydrolase [Saccharospirillum sp. MSK14-1]|uniref:nucleoside triphosphate pyrophosphohydrolase n=1 Tax=Saccharospirillum sp. MSK14-1 TaxID=1897632 RepID=UPI000D36C77A|nr:nucleoside triphosphate pyrophosphohydrolase [Saccharospirillum sp. MSK14-1]PTY38911.1 nucleoside triphosphate pyrophosphohydrolase [Saccharospirillum sp. MSK14-1]
MSERRYGYDDLKTLMQRLRDPIDGCPWDLQQDYRSIVPHTLEEVYEVIDTIERGDYPHLREELGDLIFQVVFYAQIAREEERFDLDDVIHDLVVKLLYRHPHVFPEGTLDSRVDPEQRPETEAVNRNWDKLKDQEKVNKPQTNGLLDDIPRALPGLLRARKLQSRAARVGFDWPSTDEVYAKIDEELGELREAEVSGDADAIEDELGDVLFVMANLARHLNVDPEQALRRTMAKFEHRFGHVQQQVRASGSDWSAFSLEQLDVFWEEAKQRPPEPSG